MEAKLKWRTCHVKGCRGKKNCAKNCPLHVTLDNVYCCQPAAIGFQVFRGEKQIGWVHTIEQAKERCEGDNAGGAK